MSQPFFPHKPVEDGGIRIVFNEVQRTIAGTDDFDGNAPNVSAEEPKYGSIVYNDCANAGLFTFQQDADQPWSADSLDWINVWRIVPYIDLANITDFTVTIVSPEVAQSGLSFPEAVWVTNLADYTNALMEKLMHLSQPLMQLRPGSQLKVTTAGATVPQMVEVWWERLRQIRPDAYGNEVFAYGV